MRPGRHRWLDHWPEIDRELSPIDRSGTGEKVWPPLALPKALLSSVWSDLSDMKLAEALDERSSFRRFCGFAASEPTPERIAFVRFRKEFVRHGLDTVLFEAVTRQLDEKNVMAKTGTLVDATIIASASLTKPAIQRIRRPAGSALAAQRPCTAPRPMWRPMSKAASCGASRWRRSTSMTARMPGAVLRRWPASDPGNVHADPAYASSRNETLIRDAGGSSRLPGRAIRGGAEALERLEAWNSEVGHVRLRIEKVFGTWKRSYGLRRMRWIGLAKAGLQVRLTAIAFNLTRTRDILRERAA